jgi:RNA polymerase sigma-70 factor (ECF subfamily)
MTSRDDDLQATRLSLLGRLKDLEDQDGWRRFLDTYGPLLQAVARRAGLNEAEAQDVVQETVVAVARGIDRFRAQPRRGSFKAWLRQILRRRIASHFERRAREARLQQKLPAVPGVTSRPPGTEDLSRTATVERVPDPATMDLDRHWEDQWATHLTERALAALRARLSPGTFQVFDLYAVKGLPARQVSRLTGVSVPGVYLVKHRVSRELRREVQRLEAAEEAGLGG